LWLGTWRLGGEGFGPANLKETVQVLEYAYEMGIRNFDTAGFYAHGQSDLILSRLTQKYRSKIIVSSKGGLCWENQKNVKHNASKEALKKDLNETLLRLKTTYLDYYLLHWPDPNQRLEHSIEALISFQQEGLIKKWGFSNLSIEQIETIKPFIHHSGVPVLHQVHHNLIHQQNELLDFTQSLNIENAIYSPFEQGLLANPIVRYKENPIGYIRERNPYFSDPKIHRQLHLIERKLRTLGVDKKFIALYFLLNDKRFSNIILGCHSIDQLSNLFFYIGLAQESSPISSDIETIFSEFLCLN
jgi:methylglyoxal reductase